MSTPTARRRQRGQALAELALVAPVLFFVLFGMFDMMRIGQIHTTVAEAARQGARQAVPNAVASDQPFGLSNGQPCSGTTTTSAASGTGCLTDGRILETVDRVLGWAIANSTVYDGKSAADCPVPAAGQASVCVTPTETGSAGTYADCASAAAQLGRDPQPGDLGARSAEWGSPAYQGCFLVQVTVVVHYAPMTPMATFLPSGAYLIKSSTTMVSEY